MATPVGTLIARLVLFAGEFQSDLHKVETQLQAFSTKANTIGRNMQRNITTPFLIAGGAATFFAGRFEAELTKIETLVGVNAELVGKWRDQLLQMAPAVGRGPGELAKALFVVTSAGQRGAEAMNILEASAKASAIGLGETRDVARTVTAVMTAYGTENISAARAVEVLVKTVREGNLEASELASSLGRVIGIASQVGVAFEEVGSFIATFTRLGVNANEAVTALRGTLNLLLKPTKEGREALIEIGSSVDALRTSVGERGLTRSLIDLLEKIGDNDDALGKIIPNVRALAGVLGVAGAQSMTAAEISRSLGDALLVVEQGFERTSETANQKFKSALAALEASAIRLGDIMLPVFKDIVDGITRLATAFGNLDPALQKTTVQLFAIAAAAGPVLRLLGLLAKGASAFIGAFTGGVAGGAVFGSLVTGLGGLAIALLGTQRMFTKNVVAAAQASRQFDLSAQAVERLKQKLRELDEAERERSLAALERLRAEREREQALLSDYAAELSSLQRQLEGKEAPGELFRTGGSNAVRDRIAELRTEITGMNDSLNALIPLIGAIERGLGLIEGAFDDAADAVRDFNNVIAGGAASAQRVLSTFSDVASTITSAFAETGNLERAQQLLTQLARSLGRAAADKDIDIDVGQAEAAIDAVEAQLVSMAAQLGITREQARAVGAQMRLDMRGAASSIDDTTASVEEAARATRMFSSIWGQLGNALDGIIGDLIPVINALQTLDRVAAMLGNRNVTGPSFLAGLNELEAALAEATFDAESFNHVLDRTASILKTAFRAGIIDARELQQRIAALEQMLGRLRAAGDITEEQYAEGLQDLRDTVRNLDLGGGESLADTLYQVGRNAGEQLIYGLITGIRGIEDLLKSVVARLVSVAIMNVITGALGIASPSRVARGWGQAVGQGLALGMRDTAAMVRSASAGLANVATQTSRMTGAMAPAGGRSVLRLEVPPMDFTRLPRPLTPREAAMQRDWMELFDETLKGIRYASGR